MTGVPEPIDILYVIGPYRTGTTLLSRMLLAEPGYAALGEFARVADPTTWELPCGCARPHSACDYWRDVLDRLATVDARGAWLRVVRSAALGKARALVTGRTPPSLEAGLRDLHAAYRLLAQRHPGQVLVDESKLPWFGFVLARQPWARVTFVEVFRNPSDVVESWRHDKDYLPAVDAEFVAGQWLRMHLVAALVRLRTRAPWYRVPFESLVAEPRDVLAAVTGRAGSGITRSGDHWAFACGPNHIYAGNPDKLRRGTEHLRPRDADPERTRRPGRWERLATLYWRRARPSEVRRSGR